MISDIDCRKEKKNGYEWRARKIHMVSIKFIKRNSKNRRGKKVIKIDVKYRNI